MNIKFSRNEFIQEFGHDSIEKLFPLEKILDLTSVKLDLMANPAIAIIKHEYLTALDGDDQMHWRLEVQYWLEGGRLKAKICSMTLFDSKKGLLAAMAKSKKGRLELNQN